MKPTDLSYNITVKGGCGRWSGDSFGLAWRNFLFHNKEKVMYRVSVRALSLDEMQSPDEQKQYDEFDAAIKMKLGPGMGAHEFKIDHNSADFETLTRDACVDKDEP
jgi:hypothetical protein